MSLWDMVKMKLLPSHERVSYVIIQFLNGDRVTVQAPSRFIRREELNYIQGSPLVDWVAWEEKVIPCE